MKKVLLVSTIILAVVILLIAIKTIWVKPINIATIKSNENGKELSKVRECEVISKDLLDTYLGNNHVCKFSRKPKHYYTTCGCNEGEKHQIGIDPALDMVIQENLSPKQMTEITNLIPNTSEHESININGLQEVYYYPIYNSFWAKINGSTYLTLNISNTINGDEKSAGLELLKDISANLVK